MALGVDEQALVAVIWYGFDDVDYLWGVPCGPHHTWLRTEPVLSFGQPNHAAPAHDLAAARAVVLTPVAVLLAPATRAEKLKPA